MVDWINDGRKTLEQLKDYVSPTFVPKSNGDRFRYDGYEKARRGGYLGEYGEQNFIHNLWRRAQSGDESALTLYSEAHERWDSRYRRLENDVKRANKKRSRVSGLFRCFGTRYRQLTYEINELNDEIRRMDEAEYQWKIRTNSDRKSEKSTRRGLAVAGATVGGAVLLYKFWPDIKNAYSIVDGYLNNRRQQAAAKS